MTREDIEPIAAGLVNATRDAVLRDDSAKDKILAELDRMRKEMHGFESGFSAVWAVRHLTEFVESIQEEPENVPKERDPHTAAVIAVLTKRAGIVRKVIQERIKQNKHFDVSFFAGKREGYEQAIDLLESSTESIRIEL